MKYQRLKLALIIFFCFQFCLLILFLFYILGRERFSIKEDFCCGFDSKGLGSQGGGGLAGAILGYLTSTKSMRRLCLWEDILLSCSFHRPPQILCWIAVKKYKHCFQLSLREVFQCFMQSFIRLHLFTQNKCFTVIWAGSTPVAQCFGSLCFLQPWRSLPHTLTSIHILIWPRCHLVPKVSQHLFCCIPRAQDFYLFYCPC